jgi:two-component system, cell cycle response regulator DivK
MTVTGSTQPSSTEGEKAAPVAKILLVEDNEMNRDMLSRRLQRKGYLVVMAEDGAQGVLLARKETPDVILLDMSLPVIDGWTAARELKSDDATRLIPIIALTAHAMSGDREKALDAGCDEYDTKPVEMPRLLGKIEALLEKKPAAS